MSDMSEIRLSIVIPVLDSHEIVRRQTMYWYKMKSRGIEMILIDDGSDPPLQLNPLFKVICTGDKSPWSEHMATNFGIQNAQGEYILKTDIDHILSERVIKEALKFEGDCLRYRNRSEAMLNENGEIICTDIIRKPHSNTFIMKKSVFDMLGGYNEYGKGYDAGGSIDLWYRYLIYVNADKIKDIEWSKEFIYVWPNSPINPTEDQHLFHNLRKTL